MREVSLEPWSPRETPWLKTAMCSPWHKKSPEDMGAREAARTVGIGGERRSWEVKGRTEERKAARRLRRGNRTGRGRSEARCAEAQSRAPWAGPALPRCQIRRRQRTGLGTPTGGKGRRQQWRSRGRRAISFQKSAVGRGREPRNPSMEAVVISGSIMEVEAFPAEAEQLGHARSTGQQRRGSEGSMEGILGEESNPSGHGNQAEKGEMCRGA